MKKLQDKVAIITGSTRGIGRATAKMLAEQGAKIVACERSVQAGEALAAETAEAGGTAKFITLDALSTDSIDNLVETTLAEFGAIDILVNCAASDDPISITRIPDISIEDYDRVMDVNVKAPFILCQKIIPVMEKNGGGTIVNVASIASKDPGRGPIVYTISKHAMLGLTREIEYRHGKNGIRANSVLPGSTYTELTKETFDNPDSPASKRIAAIPAGKPCMPEDQAAVIAFLCSPESWYIQGADIVVDGGNLCH